ncbi:hypothetical protein KUV51_16790 [Tateyamaria omphalii]|uniref:hypothetical protein n=1 Tax=Tateyamaria omphalii TaxID=299262 RepID=UPI001C997EC4|nr:hypothetical protein [Tateyamaria omphalii]MBY5934667.1 hypothetical protein [Tateyamaria omphalii]
MTGIALQFGIALVFMAVAAVIGYLLSRQKYRNESAAHIAMLSGETAKWRRRASVAEDRARSAENALVRERRKSRR